MAGTLIKSDFGAMARSAGNIRDEPPLARKGIDHCKRHPSLHAFRSADSTDTNA
jgi:hypothetical protein